MQKILILFHCEANTGYAISSLEQIFWAAALKIAHKPENIFLCYPSYSKGRPDYPPESFNNYFEFSPKESVQTKLNYLYDFIKTNEIEILLGFDQPVSRPYYRYARKAGIKRFVSYQGAPMSSIKNRAMLLLKKLEVKSYINGPDHYIFESEAMRETATKGRGIPHKKTSVCYLGVNTEQFKPSIHDKYYAHDILNIARDQKLIFYSGHFEERKGVRVITLAANTLCAQRSDVTFILFGDKNDEAAPYKSLLNKHSKNKVIYGGYRNDLYLIHRSCYAGVIASIGWDSFTMSAVEMLSSGLPIFVSSLQGLKETISDGASGYTFEPGNEQELAVSLLELMAEPAIYDRMRIEARNRALQLFSRDNQIKTISEKLKSRL